MTLNLNFRAVGLYAYLPNLSFPNLSENSSIAQILIALQSSGLTFQYGPTLKGKLIVTGLSYDYTDSSSFPPNVADRPAPNPPRGNRSITTKIGDVAHVWQYYRSAIVEIAGVPVEIRNQTQGQPSFALTTIGEGLVIPPGGTLLEYKLVFRNVTIDLTAEKANDYLNAKMNAKLGNIEAFQ